MKTGHHLALSNCKRPLTNLVCFQQLFHNRWSVGIVIADTTVLFVRFFHDIQQLYDETLSQWAAILQDTGDHDSITLRRTAWGLGHSLSGLVDDCLILISVGLLSFSK